MAKRVRRPKPQKPISDHHCGMRRAYALFHRRRLQQQGIPDRRSVAEVVMRIVIKSTCALEPSAARSFARQILKESGQAMLEMLNHNGGPKYSRAGILKR